MKLSLTQSVAALAVLAVLASISFGIVTGNVPPISVIIRNPMPDLEIHVGASAPPFPTAAPPVHRNHHRKAAPKARPQRFRKNVIGCR
jgi:hypothetical protein